MRQMKDSGISWIGMIPEHWKVEALGRHFSFGKGLPITKADLLANGIAVISYGQIHAKFNPGTTMLDSMIRFVSPTFLESNSQCLLRKGDFIFADTSEDIEGSGNCAYNDYKGSIFAGYHTVIARPQKMGFTKYLAYLFQSSGWKYQIQSLVNGVKVYSINKSILKISKIILPPLSEQQAIADYLDVKCGEVDALVSLQEEMISELQAYKQAVITEAVTHGLNPNAKMKDSNVQWIGRVPEHWDTLRLRFVCELRNGYTPPKANPEFWTDGTIPWYRMDDIRESGRRLKEAKQYITEEAVKGGGLFEAGSFIMATTATIGEHAVLIVDSLANQRFTNLKIRKSLSDSLLSDYFFYYLFVVDDYCKTTTRTATFPAVNMEDLKNFAVCIPPVEEQRKIVESIEKRCADIDALIGLKQQKIEELKEYKKSLIFECVTGKREIHQA